MASLFHKHSCSSKTPIWLDVSFRLQDHSQEQIQRQAFSDSEKAGQWTIAESCGTGRAADCIPRVGRLRKYVLQLTYVRTHQDLAQVQVKVNQNQRRFAVVSALAALALLSLALARGHRIEQIEDVPLVIASAAESFTKTSEAVSNSRKLRAGKGKMRNRRHRQRRGPLVVYNEDNGIVNAFRNLPGFELANVWRLNLLQLARCGGHLGAFVIWTNAAFGLLDEVFGTRSPHTRRTTYVQDLQLRRHSAGQQRRDPVRCPPAGQKVEKCQEKNPLVNMAMLFRLNPYAKTIRKHEILKQEHLKKKGTKNPKHPTAAHEAFTALPKASVDRHTCFV
ncbi:ribosomal protein L4 domain-containing protein [Mycena galericulata]|nr:ribosomal protein L4 domain-containing protein [Mycena galericulata]KAJ7449136.1 ribosomal protein L4 domain-containing protein [Mycena galericulata]